MLPGVGKHGFWGILDTEEGVYSQMGHKKMIVSRLEYAIMHQS